MNEKKNEGLIKDAYEPILREFQSVITIFYLVLVAIGMLFNYYKYSEFGINIFQYADAFDFLIAPFEDLKIILFSFLSTLVPYLAFRFDLYIKNKRPVTYSRINFGLEKKSWFNAYRTILYSGVLILYLYAAASEYGISFKKQIKDQSTLSIEMKDNQVERGILIGKTKDMLFLHQNERVTAIPINSVEKIEIRK